MSGRSIEEVVVKMIISRGEGGRNRERGKNERKRSYPIDSTDNYTSVKYHIGELTIMPAPKRERQTPQYQQH